MDIGKVNTLEYYHTLTEILSNAVTIIAVVIAALWTLFLVAKYREKYPKTEMVNVVELIMLPDKNARIAIIQVEIKNIGKVLLKLGSVIINIQFLYPFSEKDTKLITEALTTDRRYYELASGYSVTRKSLESNKTLEPGEKEAYSFFLILPGPSLNGLIVDSQFENRKTGKWWNKLTVTNLDALKSKN